MSTLTLKTYEILKARLGEEKASTLIGYIDEKFKEKMIRDKDIFLTKDAKTDLIKWMIGFWIVQMAAIGGLYLKMSDLAFRMSDLTVKLSELSARFFP